LLLLGIIPWHFPWEVGGNLAGPRISKRLGAWAVRTRRRWTTSSEEERNTLYLYMATASRGPIQAGIVAYLSVYLARLGASTQQIGLLSSVPAIVGALVMIPAGFVAERVRDQVRLRILSETVWRSPALLMAIAPLVFGPSMIPAVAVGLMAVQSASMSVAKPALMTVMTDAVAPRNRARVNGTRWALLNVLSAVLAPLFGRMLDVVEFPFNYQILFLMSFTGGLGSIYFFSRVRVPPLEVLEGKSWRLGNLREGLHSYISSIRGERKFVLLLLGTVAFRVALNMPLPLYSLYWVNELRVSNGLIGLRETAACSALVVGYLAWGRLASGVRPLTQLTAGALLLGLYPVATGLIPGGAWLVPVAFIWGLAMSGVNIGLFGIMLGSVPKEKMPRLSAVFHLVANGAASIGPFLGVALSQATSIRTALLIIGGVIILSTIPFCVVPSDV